MSPGTRRLLDPEQDALIWPNDGACSLLWATRPWRSRDGRLAASSLVPVIPVSRLAACA